MNIEEFMILFFDMNDGKYLVLGFKFGEIMYIFLQNLTCK